MGLRFKQSVWEPGEPLPDDRFVNVYALGYGALWETRAQADIHTATSPGPLRYRIHVKLKIGTTL